MWKFIDNGGYELMIVSHYLLIKKWSWLESVDKRLSKPHKSNKNKSNKHKKAKRQIALMIFQKCQTNDEQQ